jgi:hypothetical protein
MKIFFLQPRKFVCRIAPGGPIAAMSAKISLVRSLLIFLALALGLSACAAQFEPAPTRFPRQIQLGTPISTAVSNQFPAGVTAGGSVKIFEVDTWGGYSQRINERWQIGLAGTYEFTEFDFSGMNHFYNPRPWSELHIFGGGIPILYNLSDRWTLTLVPVAQVAGEPGVNWGSAISYGGL